MFIFRKNKKNSKKAVFDKKTEELVRLGREQFEILMKKGLRIPVVLL